MTNDIQIDLVESENLFLQRLILHYNIKSCSTMCFKSSSSEKGGGSSPKEKKETFADASYRKIHIIAELDGYYATADRSIVGLLN
ncbi:unnamed protein product [Sphenostylis stenocarpa]|uniref:Uncharacterized protein n=1 Tax=Sphenostylis stenocarpa TaxID=92480 RepID=A0AA86STA0_9FABA|nr:unnamed protein product [Sphenostylis stenocarpa]